VGAAEAQPVEVSFVTSDSVTIHGTYYPVGNSPAPAVVLLHMLGKSRRDWSVFAESAAWSGFAVLAIDLRGHGQSTAMKSGSLSVKTMSPADFSAMTKDVEASVEWLRNRRDVDSGAIALVGASIGANVALTYGAGDTAIRAVVLLSPGEVYRGFALQPALREYVPRRLLAIAAEDDNYSLLTVRSVAREDHGKVDVQVYSDGGHGTYLLAARPELAGRVIEFLNTCMKLTRK